MKTITIDGVEYNLLPKAEFKVGDWVVFNDSHNSIYQISEIRDSYYMLTHTHGGSMPLSFSQVEFIRPWSIEDAKDGDVLANDNGWACIFKAFDGWTFSSYCFMDSQNWFCEFGSEVHTPDSKINGNIHPATKEQRDLLFKKMKKAGYTWDEKKKELKKIPVETKFKVGNWVVSTRNQILTYRILEPNISNELGKLDYKVEIYSDGIYEKTCLIPSSKMDEWGRLWTIVDAKDGDVLTDGKKIVIFNKFEEPAYKQHIIAYVGLDLCGKLQITEDTWRLGVDKAMPATKEQRDRLFSKMKEAGYEWDADKKELRKIQPHYDIKNFKPFDKVLVRCGNDEEWMIEFYCKYDTLVHTSPHRDYPFMGIGDSYSQCIPFNEETKHLLGTTDPCDECYINW